MQVLDTSVVISLFKAFWYGTKARFLGSKLGGVFTHYRLTADKHISCEAPNKLIRDGWFKKLIVVWNISSQVIQAVTFFNPRSLEVTNNLWKGHVLSSQTRSPAELPGVFFIFHSWPVVQPLKMKTTKIFTLCCTSSHHLTSQFFWWVTHHPKPNRWPFKKPRPGLNFESTTIKNRLRRHRAQSRGWRWMKCYPLDKLT